MKSSHYLRLLLAGFAIIFSSPILHASTGTVSNFAGPAEDAKKELENQRADYIRKNYAKFEYRIPARDGSLLFTSVYVPNDASASKRYPILLVRTPYSVAPYGTANYKRALGPTLEYEKEGYIFVFQDVRGRNMSEGKFIDMTPHQANKKSK